MLVSHRAIEDVISFFQPFDESEPKPDRSHPT
jgi:hypothetical protein